MNEEKIKKGAKVLAFRICKGALYNAKEFMNKYQELILKEKKKITNEEINNLYCQFALLFYHITDRISMGILRPEKRNKFMMKLWFYLWTDHIILPEFSKDELKEYQEETKNMYDLFIDKYSKCEELIRSFEEGLGNTLLFEFSRDITKFTEYPDDIAGVMLCHSLIVDTLGTINIREILDIIK